MERARSRSAIRNSSVISSCRALGGTPPAASIAATCLGRSESTQRAGREVDRDGQRLALRVPGCDLAQGLSEYRPGRGGHQPGFLDQVQKDLGVEQPPGGVVPAHQRLHAVHVAGGQVDLGLVVHDELVTLQCGSQLLHRLQPGGVVGVVRAAVHVMAAQ
jgi:hypothetical protein